MIRISLCGNGHKMLFSKPGSGERGYSVQARSHIEIHLAIDHYLGSDRVAHVHGYLGNKADESQPVSKLCPLCRRAADNAKKKPRKRKESVT